MFHLSFTIHERNVMPNKVCAIFKRGFFSKIHVCLLISSRGHADAEIEAVFAKYDVDGDRVLDEEECKNMQEDLEGQKVS